MLPPILTRALHWVPDPLACLELLLQPGLWAGGSRLSLGSEAAETQSHSTELQLEAEAQLAGNQLPAGPVLHLHKGLQHVSPHICPHSPVRLLDGCGCTLSPVSGLPLPKAKGETHSQRYVEGKDPPSEPTLNGTFQGSSPQGRAGRGHLNFR